MIDIGAPLMASAEHCEIKTTISLEGILYDLTFYLLENIISVEVNKAGDLFKTKYLKNLTIEEFYGLDKIFKQFDNLSEVFESIKKISKKKDTFSISVLDDKLQLIIKYPTINENEYKELPILLIQEDSKENIVPKLCEIIADLNNKVADLTKRLNYATNFLVISKDRYEELIKMPILTKQIFSTLTSSVIISPMDLAVIELGIKKKLNQNIKSLQLLFNSNMNGDLSKSFHALCDHHYNTLTVVLSNNNRRFGGFTTAEWDQNYAFKVDEKAFIFSLDDRICYYLKYDPKNKSGTKAIFCDASYGPVFGGHDFYLCNCCKTKGRSYDMTPTTYDTYGKKYALNLVSGFTVVCYEVYELSFE